MSERMQNLQRMLRASPDDVFLHYSLGMEYAGAGRHDEAGEQFQRCLDLDETYLPAWVEAGKCHRSAGRLDEARKTFAAGMELAANQGESHVRDFLQQQLDALGPTRD